MTHSQTIRKNLIFVFAIALAASVWPGAARQGAALTPRMRGASRPGFHREGAAGPLFLPAVVNGLAPNLAVTLDGARATSATIGSDGGVIRATGASGAAFELNVPPGALDFDEVITLTPVANVRGLPLNEGRADMVDLQPAGLFFYTPTVLSITSTVAPSGPVVVGIAFDASGRFHLRSLPPASSTAQSVWMLRGYGVGSASPAQIAAAARLPEPADSFDAFEQSVLLSQSTGQVSAQDASLDRVFAQYFLSKLINELQAATSDAALVETAWQHYQQWVDGIDTYLLRTSLRDRYDAAINAAIAMLTHAASTSAQRCTSQKRPEESFALLRLLNIAKNLAGRGGPDVFTRAALTILVDNTAARLQKCLTFKVTFHSQVRQTSNTGTGMLVTVEAVATLQAAAGSVRATGAAALDYIDLKWLGPLPPCGNELSGSSATWDAQSAGLGLSITPVSRTSRAMNIVLRYAPGETQETQKLTCNGIVQKLTWHIWWPDYMVLHQYEAGDANGSLRSVAPGIVNAGTFTGWVYQNNLASAGLTISEDSRIDVAHTPQP